MRGHRAFLSSLTLFQRQIWPCCRSRPRGRGMELSTASHGCTLTCWESGTARGGPFRPRLSGVRLSGSAPTTTEGAPGKQVPLEDRQPRCRDLPGAFSFPVPIPRQAQPCSGQPGEQSPPEPAPQEGCPHLPQPHLSGLHLALPRCLGNFFWKSCRSAAFCSIFPIPASRRFSRAPWAFSEMSNPRRSP